MKTKIEQAYIKLRGMILGGKFHVGSHWTVRSLAKDLKYSPITINQALQRLQQDGLIEIRPQSGIFLRNMDADELREFKILRQALEVQAVRLLTKNVNAADIKALRNLARGIQAALQKGNPSKANELDHAFHNLLIEKADCRPLTEAFERIISICMVVPDINAPWHEHKKGRYCGHSHLVDQIESGDPMKAERAMRAHLSAELTGA